MNDLLTPEAEAADRLGATAVLPPFDDSAALARATPARRSEPIDRAYEEYHELLGHGVTVDPDAFCARFPALQTALRRLLEVHRDLEDDPELIGKIEQIGQRWPHAGEEFFGFQLLQELGRGAFA